MCGNPSNALLFRLLYMKRSLSLIRQSSMFGHSRGLSHSSAAHQQQQGHSRSSSTPRGQPILTKAAPSSSTSFAIARGSTSAAIPQAAAHRPPLADASFMTQVTKDAACGRQAAAAPAASNRAPTTKPRNATVYESPYNAGRLSLLPHHPFSHSRPLLVLDLDETLVHASVEHTTHDVAFNVDMGSQIIPVFVKIRPFAREFLQRVATLFEVAVFTASLAPYADQVVNHLDPTRSLVHHRLYRQHCTNVDGSFIKDLSLLGRSMERVAIVDNSPVAYSFHPEHGIPILSWFDDRGDSELLSLMPMLEHFAATSNIHATTSKFR